LIYGNDLFKTKLIDLFHPIRVDKKRNLITLCVDNVLRSSRKRKNWGRARAQEVTEKFIPAKKNLFLRDLCASVVKVKNFMLCSISALGYYP